MYKLEWLAALNDTATGWLADDPAAPIALVGDWNIAPTDEDVWDVDFFKGATHVTEPERAAFRDHRSPIHRRGKAFHARTRCLHVLGLHATALSRSARACASTSSSVRPPLAARVTDAEIVRDERKPGKKGTPAPSDHAPVLVDLSDG